MGIISDSVLQHGGSVIAVVPDAMLRAGGEGEPRSTWGHIGHEELEEKGRDKVCTVIDDIGTANGYFTFVSLIKGRICEHSLLGLFGQLEYIGLVGFRLSWIPCMSAKWRWRTVLGGLLLCLVDTARLKR